MRILYFDCTGGISGDMLRNAVTELSGRADEIRRAAADMDFAKYTEAHTHHEDPHDHGCGHAHGHHEAGICRSFNDVKHIIEHSGVSEKAAGYALDIYRAIAAAEASVHGAEPETVHFHEVGRDEAIKNALGTALAVEAIAADSIMTSPLYDGHGTVVCSHGEIPVPVPAVKALMSICSYDFRTADVDTEMVTPSGLAGLIGIGAVPAQSMPEGRIIKQTEADGGRNTGRPGLKVYIIEQ